MSTSTSAPTIFGRITGLGPRSLGAAETAAAQLGISQAQATAMQQLAFEQLAAPVPEPSSWAMLAGGLFFLLHGAPRFSLDAVLARRAERTPAPG